MSQLSPNPFRPTFGITPSVWHGRSVVLEQFSQALSTGPGSPGRSVVIDGARGIGKTALMEELSDIARQKGWVLLRARSSNPFTKTLTESTIPEAIHQLDHPKKRKTKHISSVSVAGVGGTGVSESTAEGFIPTLASQLRRLNEALGPHGGGILISVDEIQDAKPEDLSEIAGAYQELLADETNIAIILAGLPAGIDRLLNLPGTTYMRRARRYTLGALSDTDAHNIFVDTAAMTHKLFTDDAATEATAFSHGYPYLVQLLGYLAWERSTSEVTVEDVHAVSDQALIELGTQIHDPSLKGLAVKQREFLQAMADLAGDDPVATSEVATHLGKTRTAVSDARQRLMDKELIEEAGRGLVRFTLPYLGHHLTALPPRQRIH